MPKTINIEQTKHVAKELLISFKSLPGFSTATIDQIEPIYGSDGSTVVYREVKFRSTDGKDNGYAVVSATQDDYPVVEFSEHGKTQFERFRDKLPSQRFRMVRFGPGYIAAETSRGKHLADIGERPSVIPRDLQVHARAEGRDQPIAMPVRPIRPRIPATEIRRARRPLDYATLKATYKRAPISRATLSRHWAIALSPNSPCPYHYYTADGAGSHTYFLQIPKNTPPNNNDHASGCGPTAWMNLVGWHDQNWRNTLLAGQPNTDNSYTRNLTMYFHDRLGTYEPWWTFGADQGFTWPENMSSGYQAVKSKLQHSCGYWYRVDWWNTDENWVFEVARDMARKKRPFIVGYYEDWHYAVGYQIAECTKHGWKEHSWIRINPGWSTNDSHDKWIPKGTIFGIYGVYNFSPLASGSVGDFAVGYDWSSKWTTAEFYTIGGKVYLFLLKSNGGIVHVQRMNDNGTVGARVDTRDWSDGWTQGKPFSVAGKNYLFLLKKGNGHVHIHKLNADGKIGAEVKRYDWSSNWTTIEFYMVGSKAYLLLLKSTDGTVKVHNMESDGTLGALVDQRDWSSGWTQGKPFAVGTKKYLFLLKKGNGHVHIHKLNADGKIGAEVKRYDWSSNWTTIEFYTVGSKTYLLLLKENGGIVHIHLMNGDGTVGPEIDRRDWSDGWTHGKPFAVANNNYLFLLKKSDGAVHIHKINP